MSFTRIINGIKYLQVHNDNNFKKLTLEDNVYFTLRDVFTNISEFQYIMEANEFNNELTGSVYNEDRKSDFKYTDALYNKLFVDRLNKWLSAITQKDFVFNYEPDDKADDEEKFWYYDMNRLIRFDDWWVQFEDLKIQIKNRFNELN